jgi:hypothetical protein
MKRMCDIGPGVSSYRVRSKFNSNKYQKVAMSKVCTSVSLSFLNTCVSKYSCIYLFDVSDSITNIDSVGGVYKYGYTNDLKRRNLEHCTKYGSGIFLAMHAFVPENFLREAENDIRKYFANDTYNDDVIKSTELVSIEDENLYKTAEHFKVISEKYLQKYTTMYDQNSIMKQILKIT